MAKSILGIDIGHDCLKLVLVNGTQIKKTAMVTMPLMTADQLVYNLPYEFRDYITDELKNYIFDYAMMTTQEELSQKQDTGRKEDETEE